MSIFVSKIQEGMRKLISREEGQDTIEYVMLISLLAFAVIALIGPVGKSVANTFRNLNSSLT